MSIFAGVDVSDKTTQVCVVNSDGLVLKRDVVASDPDLLAKWLGKHCAGLVHVVLACEPTIGHWTRTDRLRQQPAAG